MEDIFYKTDIWEENKIQIQCKYQQNFLFRKLPARHKRMIAHAGKNPLSNEFGSGLPYPSLLTDETVVIIFVER
ncbi:hypothetical protein BpHYR1_012492 [Brachionus plicatilis]|uniref:Uncharacterized protein n=1 Tax=Brachionus plicatilis TaxID=10195 RepID=A0A3M7SVV2_BRAPC|nr:hypothetical protein BpHYR1_012492 [Brachionus plicatilis]